MYCSEWDGIVNILWEADGEIDVRIEDIIVGCIRAFDAERESNTRQATVNWVKLIRVYRNCDEITRPIIQVFLRCSLSQAKRYVRMIKFINPFLTKILNSGDSLMYTDVTTQQVRLGCLNKL